MVKEIQVQRSTLLPQRIEKDYKEEVDYRQQAFDKEDQRRLTRNQVSYLHIEIEDSIDEDLFTDQDSGSETLSGTEAGADSDLETITFPKQLWKPIILAS